MARVIGGEIVNADSLQVYRYLDIGTAKPNKADREGIPHHLIDIINPDEEYNAGIYTKTARPLIAELHRESTKIIVVGGTYLYVRVLLHGIVEKIPADREIRQHLRRLKSVFGTVYLYEKLKSLDPDLARRIHRNDYVRIERALEAYYLTGEKMSQLQEKHGFKENEYDVLKIGLSAEREVLRKRIDERVDKMMEEGLLDEVKELRRMGFDRDLKPMQSIGYKQMNQYLDGEITLERAIELMKRDTKRLAKRQMTWLRQDKGIHWYQLPEDWDKLMDEVETFYRVES